MIILSLLLGLSPIAHAFPQQLTQQGRLLDSTGVAIVGQRNLTFRLFSTGGGGNPIWEETIVTLFTNGYYSVTLGDDNANPLDIADLNAPHLYLEIEVDSNGPLQPRQELSATPYARLATVAESIDGGDVNAAQISVGGVTVIDSSGSWVGPTLTVQWGDLAGIPADIADGDDDTLGGIGCQTGQILGWNGSSWGCADDNGLTEADVEGFVTNGPLNLASGTTMGGIDLLTTADLGDTLADLSCQDGELAKWDQVLGWQCGLDIQLSEAVVENYIENGPLNLDANVMIAGNRPLTEADTLSPSWADIGGVPSDLVDGDQDTLGNMACAHGQSIQWNALNSAWECIDLISSLDQDGDGALAWLDCDDSDPLVGLSSADNDCDGTPTAADCDDSDPNSTIVTDDMDCDGVLTADDCDDADAASTTVAFDADCDGILTADDCDDTDPLSSWGSSQCPAESCLDLLSKGITSSGSHFIDPTGAGPVEVYCDMDFDGGGWTLAVKYSMNSVMNTSSALNVSEMSSNAVPSLAKLSDADINAMAWTSWRIEGVGDSARHVYSNSGSQFDVTWDGHYSQFASGTTQNGRNMEWCYYQTPQYGDQCTTLNNTNTYSVSPHESGEGGHWNHNPSTSVSSIGGFSCGFNSTAESNCTLFSGLDIRAWVR